MRGFGLPQVFWFYLGLLGIAVVALATSGQLGRFVPDGGAREWLFSGALGLLAAIGLVVSSRLLASWVPWVARLAAELRNLLGEVRPRQALAMAILSGVGEEALFRGVLQPAVGLWLAAAIFGVLHTGPNQRFWPWPLMATLAGVVFGLLFEWTGSLVAPIVAHATVNYLNLRHLTATTKPVEVHLRPMGGGEAVSS